MHSTAKPNCYFLPNGLKKSMPTDFFPKFLLSVSTKTRKPGIYIFNSPIHSRHVTLFFPQSRCSFKYQKSSLIECSHQAFKVPNQHHKGFSWVSRKCWPPYSPALLRSNEWDLARGTGSWMKVHVAYHWWYDQWPHILFTSWFLTYISISHVIWPKCRLSAYYCLETFHQDTSQNDWTDLIEVMHRNTGLLEAVFYFGWHSNWMRGTRISTAKDLCECEITYI